MHFSGKHGFFIKAVSLVVAILFFVSDIAQGITPPSRDAVRHTLAPPLSTSPPCRIARMPDGTYDIITSDKTAISRYSQDADTSRYGDPFGQTLRERWLMADIGYIMGDFLDMARKDPDIKSPKVVLVPLLKKHLSGRSGPDISGSAGYDFDSMEEVWHDGELAALRVPIKTRDDTVLKMTVYLAEDKEDRGETAMEFPLRDGTMVRIEIQAPVIDAQTAKGTKKSAGAYGLDDGKKLFLENLARGKASDAWFIQSILASLSGIERKEFQKWVSAVLFEGIYPARGERIVPSQLIDEEEPRGEKQEPVTSGESFTMETDGAIRGERIARHDAVKDDAADTKVSRTERLEVSDKSRADIVVPRSRRGYIMSFLRNISGILGEWWRGLKSAGIVSGGFWGGESPETSEVLYSESFSFNYPGKEDLYHRQTSLIFQRSAIINSIRKAFRTKTDIPVETAVLVLGSIEKIVENAVDAVALRADEEGASVLPDEPITVSIERDKKKKKVSIVIKDSGTGVPLRILTRWQAGKPLSTKDTSGLTVGSDGRGAEEALRICRDHGFSLSFRTRTGDDEGHKFLQDPYGGISIERKPVEEIGTAVTLTVPEKTSDDDRHFLSRGSPGFPSPASAWIGLAAYEHFFQIVEDFWISLFTHGEEGIRSSTDTELVVGDVRSRIDREIFEETLRWIDSGEFISDEVDMARQEAGEFWRSRAIWYRYIPEKVMELLYDGAYKYLRAGEVHPDLTVVRENLTRIGAPYSLSGKKEQPVARFGRYAEWPKDGSFLLPARDNYIAHSVGNRYLYPDGGEMVSVPGEKPLLLVSGSSPFLEKLKEFMSGKPEISLRELPQGFVTVRLSDGYEVLLGTTHIDCVINAIPPSATLQGKSVFLIDHRYYYELRMRPEGADFLRDIEDLYGASFVVVPPEEAHLNPSNFILLDNSRVLLNKAPATRAALIEAGVREDALFMLDRAVTELPFMGGSIGCVTGLFPERPKIPGEADTGMWQGILGMFGAGLFSALRYFSPDTGAYPGGVMDPNPYVKERYVSRGFDELNSQFGGDITLEIDRRIAERQGRAIKILMIGVGRGFEVFELVKRYGDAVSVRSVAKEDLLYRDPEDLVARFSAAGVEINETEARALIERVLSDYVIADVESGIPGPSGFDLAIFCSAVMVYLEGKIEAVADSVTRLSDGGYTYAVLEEAYIKEELTGRTIPAERYFSIHDHPGVSVFMNEGLRFGKASLGVLSKMRQMEVQNFTESGLAKKAARYEMRMSEHDLSEDLPVMGGIGIWLSIAGPFSLGMFSDFRDTAHSHPILTALTAIFSIITASSVYRFIANREVRREARAIEEYIRREGTRTGFQIFLPRKDRDCLLSCRTLVDKDYQYVPRGKGFRGNIIRKESLIPYEPFTLGINIKSLKNLVVPFMLDPEGVTKAIKANLAHEMGHLVSGPASSDIGRVSAELDRRGIRITSDEADDVYEKEANKYLYNAKGIEGLGDYLLMAVVYGNLQYAMSLFLGGAEREKVEEVFADSAREYISALFPGSLTENEKNELVGRVTQKIAELMWTYIKNLDRERSRPLIPRKAIKVFQRAGQAFEAANIHIGDAKGPRLPSEYLSEHLKNEENILPDKPSSETGEGKGKDRDKLFTSRHTHEFADRLLRVLTFGKFRHMPDWMAALFVAPWDESIRLFFVDSFIASHEPVDEYEEMSLMEGWAWTILGGCAAAIAAAYPIPARMTSLGVATIDNLLITSVSLVLIFYLGTIVSHFLVNLYRIIWNVLPGTDKEPLLSTYGKTGKISAWRSGYSGESGDIVITREDEKTINGFCYRGLGAYMNYLRKCGLDNLDGLVIRPLPDTLAIYARVRTENSHENVKIHSIKLNRALAPKGSFSENLGKMTLMRVLEEQGTPLMGSIPEDRHHQFTVRNVRYGTRGLLKHFGLKAEDIAYFVYLGETVENRRIEIRETTKGPLPAGKILAVIELDSRGLPYGITGDPEKERVGVDVLEMLADSGKLDPSEGVSVKQEVIDIAVDGHYAVIAGFRYLGLQSYTRYLREGGYHGLEGLRFKRDGLTLAVYTLIRRDGDLISLKAHEIRLDGSGAPYGVSAGSRPELSIMKVLEKQNIPIMRRIKPERGAFGVRGVEYLAKGFLVEHNIPAQNTVAFAYLGENEPNKRIEIRPKLHFFSQSSDLITTIDLDHDGLPIGVPRESLEKGSPVDVLSLQYRRGKAGPLKRKVTRSVRDGRKTSVSIEGNQYKYIDLYIKYLRGDTGGDVVGVDLEKSSPDKIDIFAVTRVPGSDQLARERIHSILLGAGGVPLGARNPNAKWFSVLELLERQGNPIRIAADNPDRFSVAGTHYSDIKGFLVFKGFDANEVRIYKVRGAETENRRIEIRESMSDGSIRELYRIDLDGDNRPAGAPSDMDYYTLAEILYLQGKITATELERYYENRRRITSALIREKAERRALSELARRIPREKRQELMERFRKESASEEGLTEKTLREVMEAAGISKVSHLQEKGGWRLYDILRVPAAKHGLLSLGAKYDLESGWKAFYERARRGLKNNFSALARSKDEGGDHALLSWARRYGIRLPKASRAERFHPIALPARLRSRYDLITEKEAEDLWGRTRSGDQQARDELLGGLTRMAVEWLEDEKSYAIDLSSESQLNQKILDEVVMTLVEKLEHTQPRTYWDPNEETLLMFVERMVSESVKRARNEYFAEKRQANRSIPLDSTWWSFKYGSGAGRSFGETISDRDVISPTKTGLLGETVMPEVKEELARAIERLLIDKGVAQRLEKVLGRPFALYLIGSMGRFRMALHDESDVNLILVTDAHDSLMESALEELMREMGGHIAGKDEGGDSVLLIGKEGKYDADRASGDGFVSLLDVFRIGSPEKGFASIEAVSVENSRVGAIMMQYAGSLREDPVGQYEYASEEKLAVKTLMRLGANLIEPRKYYGTGPNARLILESADGAGAALSEKLVAAFGPYSDDFDDFQTRYFENHLLADRASYGAARPFLDSGEEKRKYESPVSGISKTVTKKMSAVVPPASLAGSATLAGVIFTAGLVYLCLSSRKDAILEALLKKGRSGKWYSSLARLSARFLGVFLLDMTRFTVTRYLTRLLDLTSEVPARDPYSVGPLSGHLDDPGREPVSKLPFDEHMYSGDKFGDLLEIIHAFGPDNRPSDASIQRRELLKDAYDNIVAAVKERLQGKYPETDLSSLNLIITAGGSTLTGVARDGSDLDLYFLVDDTSLGSGIKIGHADEDIIVMEARKVLNRMIQEKGLADIRVHSMGRIVGKKVWFLSRILEKPGDRRWHRPISNVFLSSLGPVDSVREKVLTSIESLEDPVRKWRAVQKKWKSYVNGKHLNRLDYRYVPEGGLGLELPDLETLRAIYGVMPHESFSEDKKDSVRAKDAGVIPGSLEISDLIRRLDLIIEDEIDREHEKNAALAVFKKLEDALARGGLSMGENEFYHLAEMHRKTFGRHPEYNYEIRQILVLAMKGDRSLFTLLMDMMEERSGMRDEILPLLFVYISALKNPGTGFLPGKAKLEFVRDIIRGSDISDAGRVHVLRDFISLDPSLRLNTDEIRVFRKSLAENDENAAAYFRERSEKENIVPDLLDGELFDISLIPDLGGDVILESGDTAELKEEDPAFFSLLFHPENAKKLLKAATQLRLLYSYDKSASRFGVTGPLDTALHEGRYFHLAEGIYITPFSESFRRHIVFRMDGEGKTTRVYEIKIPGQMEHKRLVFEHEFNVGKEFARKDPKLVMVDPVGFHRLPYTELELYGENMDFSSIKIPQHDGERGAAIEIFEYQDGRRLNNVRETDLKEIAERYPIYGDDKTRVARDITRQVLSLTRRIHEMGYVGTNPEGSDMHLENFRLVLEERGIKVMLVADFAAYTSKNITEQDIADDLRRLIEGPHAYAMYYSGLSNIFEKSSLSEEECYEMYYSSGLDGSDKPEKTDISGDAYTGPTRPLSPAQPVTDYTRHWRMFDISAPVCAKAEQYFIEHIRKRDLYILEFDDGGLISMNGDKDGITSKIKGNRIVSGDTAKKTAIGGKVKLVVFGAPGKRGENYSGSHGIILSSEGDQSLAGAICTYHRDGNAYRVMRHSNLLDLLKERLSDKDRFEELVSLFDRKHALTGEQINALDGSENYLRDYPYRISLAGVFLESVDFKQLDLETLQKIDFKGAYLQSCDLSWEYGQLEAGFMRPGLGSLNLFEAASLEGCLLHTAVAQRYRNNIESSGYMTVALTEDAKVSVLRRKEVSQVSDVREEVFENKYSVTGSELLERSVNEIWKDLDRRNIRRSRARAEDLKKEFKRMYPSDLIAVKVGNSSELESFVESIVSRENLGEHYSRDIGDYFNALWFSIENLRQHGEDMGFLLLRLSRQDDSKMRYSFILVDRGQGFTARDGGHVAIHEAVKPEISSGEGGGQGNGLAYAAGEADKFRIMTIDNSSGQARGYLWEKGDEKESIVQDVPVPNGTKIEYVRSFGLSAGDDAGSGDEIKAFSRKVLRTVIPGAFPHGQKDLFYAGESIDFEREFARWAGLAETFEKGETWRYDARQALNDVPHGSRRAFLESARMSVRYLAENVSWHAGGEGILMAGYDETKGEGYVAVLDSGIEGFPRDAEGLLDIEITEGGFLKQKSPLYRGDGIALGRVISKGDVTIFSHGQKVHIRKGEKAPGKIQAVHYTGPGHKELSSREGSFVIVRFREGKLPKETDSIPVKAPDVTETGILSSPGRHAFMNNFGDDIAGKFLSIPGFGSGFSNAAPTATSLKVKGGQKASRNVTPREKQRATSGSRTERGYSAEIPDGSAELHEREAAHARNFRTLIGYIKGRESGRMAAGLGESRPGIIAVGRSWIKGYEQGKYLQYDALNPLITMITNYCERRGIPFIIADDDDLPGLIAREKARRNMSDRTRVVMLAGADERGIVSENVRQLLDDMSYTIVGVDGQELTADSYIRIMEILTIALALSIDIHPSLDNDHLKILPPEKSRPYYIIVPHSEPMDYQTLKMIYDIQRYA